MQNLQTIAIVLNTTEDKLLKKAPAQYAQRFAKAHLLDTTSELALSDNLTVGEDVACVAFCANRSKNCTVLVMCTEDGEHNIWVTGVPFTAVQHAVIV